MTDAAPMRAKVYLDTNPIIHAVEGEIEKGGDLVDTTRQFLSACHARPGTLVTSELTLAELLAPISRQGALSYAERARLYYDLLIWNDDFELIEVTRSVLLETAELRRVLKAKKKLNLPDAIHLASAIQAECTYFVSSDNGIPVPDSMTKIDFDQTGMKQLVNLVL